MRSELFIAEGAAKLAGELQLKMQPEIKDRIGKGGLDFATKADNDSQALIKEKLLKAFPEIPIVAEEDDPHSIESDRFWVVDPIDGTVDYANNGFDWGSFIALIENGRPTVGVAHQPRRGNTLLVEAGGQCTLNDKQVELTYDKPFENAIVGTEYGWWCNKSFYDDVAFPLSQECQGMVGTLSACGSIMRLLEGRMGAYVNLGVPGKGAKLWDFAVGALAMEVLGGFATGPKGEPLRWDRIPMQAILTTRKEYLDRIVEHSRNWTYEEE